MLTRCKNSNLEFGIPPISYTYSYFKQKQHIYGQHPAEQACKIWRKNFQALLSNHILGVGSFFSAAPCTHNRQLELPVWPYTLN